MFSVAALLSVIFHTDIPPTTFELQVAAKHLKFGSPPLNLMSASLSGRPLASKSA